MTLTCSARCRTRRRRRNTKDKSSRPPPTATCPSSSSTLAPGKGLRRRQWRRSRHRGRSRMALPPITASKSATSFSTFGGKTGPSPADVRKQLADARKEGKHALAVSSEVGRGHPFPSPCRSATPKHDRRAGRPPAPPRTRTCLGGSQSNGAIRRHPSPPAGGRNLLGADRKVRPRQTPTLPPRHPSPPPGWSRVGAAGRARRPSLSLEAHAQNDIIGHETAQPGLPICSPASAG